MAYQRRIKKTSRVGTWIALGRDNMVRLTDFDDLAWDLNASLIDSKVSYCRFGGPLALYAEGNGGSDRSSSRILLFNARGERHPVTPYIQLNGIESVLFMCWNECNDNLIVVLNTGQVRFLNIGGELSATPIQLPLPELCVSTGNGVAMIIHEETLRLVLVERGENSEYHVTSLILPEALQSEKLNVMLAIPQQFSDTGYTEVFLPVACGGNKSSIYHCVFNHNSRCYDLRLSIEGGAIVHMVLSPTAKSIAFLVQDGTLYVASHSFEDIKRLLNIDTDVIPSQLLWCGEKCITYLHLARQFDKDLEFSTTLTILNVDDPEQSDFLNDLPSDAFLVSECDGIRIFSSHTYQFIQVVEEPSRRIFSVGSRANSAMLLLAFDEFMCGNANSVKMIRDLQRDPTSLSEAVDDCVAAAGFELDVSQQKRLMRVAAFGKSFCSNYESDVFVNMARRLRVLNTLWKSKTGMIISQEQFLALEGDRLAERLIQLNHHQVAYYVCENLGFSSRNVMAKWALAKLAKPTITANAEKEIAYDVIEKLRECNQSAFAEIAYTVYLKQRPHAALLMLEADNIAARQIPKLLDIKQPEVALRKALESGDADLIFTVMMHLIGIRGSNAISLLMGEETSQCMLLFYVLACESHHDLLVQYFRNHPEYQTFMNILHYFKEEDRLTKSLQGGNRDWELVHESRISTIQSASISAKRENVASSNSGILGVALSATAVVSGIPPTSCQSNEKWLRLHARLLDEQAKLMKQLNDPRFLNASIVKTVILCYEHDQIRIAEKMVRDYNLSDKMHTWSMLRAYIATSKWDLIENLGISKCNTKSDIGASAFITALFSCQQIEKAKKILPYVRPIEKRMEYYVLCGAWEEAAADCRRKGDVGLLTQLKDRARGNTRALQLIDEGWNSDQTTGLRRFSNLFS